MAQMKGLLIHYMLGPLEILEKFGGIQRKQIKLIDNDCSEMNFLLWGEQVVLANLFSVGSMLAIDRPFIASSSEGDVETCGSVCLEYGSATQLYQVPFVRQGEQSYIIDLHKKMTGVSIYGAVMDIFREENTAKSVFNLKIEDPTGTICIKLHFIESWSLGRLSLGHTVYISGLTCTMTKHKCLEARWLENDPRTSFVNLSCLPAILTSTCLHKPSYLADVSRQKSGTHICRVWLDQIEHCHVNTRLVHVACGHFVETTASGSVKCEFCCCSCEMKTRRAFHVKITVSDESGKVFAWCTGQTALELLQISPDEFYELPEEEKVMYPCSLENERYMIAIVNCGQQETIFRERVTAENDVISWEITRALKL